MIRLGLISGAGFWLLAITSGFYQLMLFETKPGELGNPPAYWPAAGVLTTQPNTPQLVLVAHPHCSCTRASLGELAIIMGKFQGQVETTVLFYSPSDFDSDWTKSDIWESAKSIPGVRVVTDRDGDIAKLFNARTSGQTLLYNGNGQISFWGGITSSRGHSGDNFGRDSIITALSSKDPEFSHTSVFGCHLTEDDALGMKEG